jgi:hypothetical protein
VRVLPYTRGAQVVHVHTSTRIETHTNTHDICRPDVQLRHAYHVTLRTASCASPYDV